MPRRTRSISNMWSWTVAWAGCVRQLVQCCLQVSTCAEWPMRSGTTANVRERMAPRREGWQSLMAMTSSTRSLSILTFDKSITFRKLYLGVRDLPAGWLLYSCTRLPFTFSHTFKTVSAMDGHEIERRQKKITNNPPGTYFAGISMLPGNSWS